MKRKGIQPGQRWRIFARDSFTCRYCGQQPPDVVLEVDHVVAVANSGSNDDDNLVTACVDCNRGKSAKSMPAAKSPGSEGLQKAFQVAAEVPAVYGCFIDAAETASLMIKDKSGVSFEVAALAIGVCAMRIAADVWNETRDSKSAKREFLKLCAAQFDESHMK